MTIQNILQAHVATLGQINKAGVDRAIQVGETQVKMLSGMIDLVDDPNSIVRVVPEPKEPTGDAKNSSSQGTV